MKPSLLLAVFFAALPLAAQDEDPGARVTVLETRVTKVERRETKVEKRVALLENEGRPEKPAATRPLTDPISAVFLGKKQVVSGETVGIKLYIELRNAANRDLEAFSGTLVFRDEKGAVVWSRPYACSDPVASGEKLHVTLGVSSEKVKAYLKLIRARRLTVALEKQEVYGAR
jgi:hypothetical protein